MTEGLNVRCSLKNGGGHSSFTSSLQWGDLYDAVGIQCRWSRVAKLNGFFYSATEYEEKMGIE